MFKKVKFLFPWELDYRKNDIFCYNLKMFFKSIFLNELWKNKNILHCLLWITYVRLKNLQFFKGCLDKAINKSVYMQITFYSAVLK